MVGHTLRNDSYAGLARGRIPANLALLILCVGIGWFFLTRYFDGYFFDD